MVVSLLGDVSAASGPIAILVVIAGIVIVGIGSVIGTVAGIIPVWGVVLQSQADSAYALRMADRALYAAKEHRDSWVGYWGARLPDDATAEAMLEFPEAATGIISIMASRPRDISRAREHSLLALAAQA